MSLLSGWSSGSCPHKRIVVVDCDDRTVRLLAARAGAGRIRVEAAVEAELPAELDLSKADEVGRFVNDLRIRAGIAPAPGLTAFGAHQVGRHEMNLPAAPEAELWPMALMQARREQHLDNMAIDFAVLSPAGAPQARVLAAAVHNDILERSRTILREAGCTADAFALRTAAVLRAEKAAGAASDQGPGVVVDVGRTHTEITVLDGQRIVACRAASAGWGFAGGTVDEPADAPADAAGADGPWMENLAQELRRTLLAYAAPDGPAGDRRIRLSIRSEHGQKLADHLSALGGLKVEPVDPAAAVEADAGVAAALRAGNFTAAVGLATQYLIDRALPIDFAHPKLETVERATREQTRVRRLAVAFAVIAAQLPPLAILFSRSREADGIREDRDTLAAREKQAKRDTEKYKVFRDLWMDKPVRSTDPAVAGEIAKETKAQKELRDELEELKQRKERRKLEEAPFRAAENERLAAQREYELFRSRAVSERAFNSALALSEIYPACQTVFGSDDEGRGKTGKIVEFRLEPRVAAGTAGKPTYPLVVKFRAETSRQAQALVDELNKLGEAQTIREQAISAAKDNLKVEFEVGYRPSFALVGGSPGTAKPKAAKTPAVKGPPVKGSGKGGRP